MDVFVCCRFCMMCCREERLASELYMLPELHIFPFYPLQREQVKRCAASTLQKVAERYTSDRCPRSCCRIDSVDKSELQRLPALQDQLEPCQHKNMWRDPKTGEPAMRRYQRITFSHKVEEKLASTAVFDEHGFSSYGCKGLEKWSAVDEVLRAGIVNGEKNRVIEDESKRGKLTEALDYAKHQICNVKHANASCIPTRPSAIINTNQ